MKWIVATPFIKTADDRWLGAFVPGDRHSFTTVPAHHQHDRHRAQTDAGGWADHFVHAWRALSQAHRSKGGLVTAFPQLPVAAGILSRLIWPRVPIVAWTFNIGKLPSGAKRRLSAFALRRVDAVVVHSRAEVDTCSEWFEIPRAKVVFVPLQRVVPDALAEEDEDAPYVVALGSANRDYALLFDVLRAKPVRTIVIASSHAVAGLDVPPCVELRAGLPLDECHRILQRARVSVIPVANATTASGQVTLLDSMGMGRATIVTRCPGSTDYVVDGETALLVSPGSREEMATALDRLWSDDDYRGRLGRQGRVHVVRHFSDAAVGRALGQVCDAVEQGRPLPSFDF